MKLKYKILMKYKSVIILFLLVACAYVGIGKENKQYIILSFTFEEPIIKKITIFNKTYDRVVIPGLPNFGNAGQPYLPVKPAYILLPQKSIIKSINIIYKDKIIIGKGYNVEISYYKKLILKIETIEKGKIDPMFRGLKKDEAIVKKLVENPEMVNSYKFKNSRALGAGPSKSYEYVIITTELLNNTHTFQDLIDLKIRKGINATIVTVEEIIRNPAYWNSSMLFNDTQAKIRNFIRDIYLNWKTDYILLGGDLEQIPARYLWVESVAKWIYYKYAI